MLLVDQILFVNALSKLFKKVKTLATSLNTDYLTGERVCQPHLKSLLRIECDCYLVVRVA